MATVSTPRLQLLKPDPTEFVDVVTHIENNWDKIDTSINAEVCTSSTRPANPYVGKTIFETDSNDYLIWNGTSWCIISHTGAWKTYTPVWTSFGATAPAIGNGTLQGRYIKVGRLVNFQITIIMGSTTTFGTGTIYQLTTPDAIFFPANGYEYMHNAVAFDTSAGTRFSGISFSGDGGDLSAKLNRTVFNSGAGFSPGAPFTWTAGDVFNCTGFYESSVD